jgi:hypothetical protein
LLCDTSFVRQIFEPPVEIHQFILAQVPRLGLYSESLADLLFGVAYGRTVLDNLASVVDPLERYGWDVGVKVFGRGDNGELSEGATVSMLIDHVASRRQHFVASNADGLDSLVRQTIDSKEFAVAREAIALGIHASVLRMRRLFFEFCFDDSEIEEFAAEGSREKAFSRVEARWLVRSGILRESGFGSGLRPSRSFFVNNLDYEPPFFRQFLLQRIGPVDETDPWPEAAW